LLLGKKFSPAFTPLANNPKDGKQTKKDHEKGILMWLFNAHIFILCF